MSETLIYIIIFAAILFFMHRGHGGCGGHSHGSHKGHDHLSDKTGASGKKEDGHQHRH